MYFAIEGVIGVGKTTLARLLQQPFEANLLLEVFEENPFLSDFYADRARYAFQIPPLLSTGSTLISDYTFEKDSLFASINLIGDELIMYQRVHEALAEKISQPDLTVYLRASTDVLMQRIASRDRPYERQMERKYIDELNHTYDEFFLFKPAPRSSVLVIETDHLDMLRSPEDLHQVENRIRQSLELVPFQPELPLT
jgi:deoxyguanosine kinase